VAVAAIIVLCLTPEALLGPGFQMSFAATTALVAVFGMIRDYRVTLGPPWLRAIMSVVISSGVAGLATAPVAAVHFNQIAHYGLLANLISVPLMGVLVMPLAVLAACLLPFGLEAYALWVMGLGLDWILGVAHWVTALDGARGTIVTPDSRVLPLMGLGFLVVILWQGRLRMTGLVPVLAAVFLWINTERPDVLIADGGALVGFLTPDGRALSKEKGAGFVAQNWLENDGDAANQQDAALRWTEAKLGDVTLRHVTGKKAAQNLDSCTEKEWIVLNAPGPKADLPCQVFDPARLRETGSLALYLGDKDEIRVVTARQVSGQRLWNTRPERPRRYQRKSGKARAD
jgi:competence protein ComEC